MITICLLMSKNFKKPSPGDRLKVLCLYGLARVGRGEYLKRLREETIIVKKVFEPYKTMIKVISDKGNEYLIIDPKKENEINPHFVLASDGPQDDSIGIGHNWDDQVLYGYEITGYGEKYWLHDVAIKERQPQFKIIEDTTTHTIYYIVDRHYTAYYAVIPK